MLLHGWGGSDYPHWQAHLASEIASGYGTVSFPLIQHPHYPLKNRWLKEIKSHLESFRPTVVVCHSLANIAWFWIADRCTIELDRLVLVSIPSLKTKHETIKSFFPAAVPENIRAKEVVVVQSDDDPWCSIEEAKEIAKQLNARFITIKKGGHINEDSGFGEWPLIKQIVKGEYDS